MQDDLQRTIELREPARRIIALYGAFNEILYAMGLGDRLLARTDADRTPPEVASLPSIGTHMRPNVERIVGLGPDLVLQMGGRKESARSVEDLERFGVTTALFRVTSFSELFSTIERVGALTGAPDKAAALADSIRARLNAVQDRLHAATHRPSVFFEVRSGNLLAAGQGSLVSDIIRLAGGENCVRLDDKLARLSEEELLRLRPEAYVSQRGPMNPDPTDIRQSERFAQLPAVRSGRVLIVDEQMFSRPGPRNVDAVELLAGFLHPDIFPEFAARAAQMEQTDD
ncbi:ABC transporter substrate-binding protein [Paucidesulfovibrio longus]|uniref:ABC transporter substrate-binding protein n=1 Tax=Paucidesulfovibrio longus TaxID=889 RepID=UPI0003FF30DD|nr:ABC transporter substrate-binding protein [Paucidesulfovibrio longus]